MFKKYEINEEIFVELNGIKFKIWKTDLDVNPISAKTLIELYTCRLIVGYVNNRGKGKNNKIKLNREHIKNIVANFRKYSVDILGVRLHFGAHYLVITNGHHRIEIMKEYFENNPDAEDFIVLVKFMNEKDGLRYYRDANNTKPHTTNNNLTNPDYAMGYQIDKIITKYNLKDTQSAQLGNVMYAYGNMDKNLNFADAFKSRNEVKKISDYIGEEEEFFKITNLTKDKLQDIYNAIEYYCEYFTHLENKFEIIKGKRRISDDLKSLKKSSPFFSVMIIDKLRKTSKFSHNWTPEELASRTFNRLGVISEEAKRITHSGKNSIENTVISLETKMTQLH